MKDIIRFVPVEVVSCVSFMSGKEKRSVMEVASIVLIPYMKSGKIVITESPFPEIFLQ